MRGLSRSIGETLRNLRTGGEAALFDAERCLGALLDTHKDHRAAVNVMTLLIRSGGARRLAAADRALAGAAIARETQTLINEHGVSEAYARGAVNAWARAFDLSADAGGDSWIGVPPVQAAHQTSVEEPARKSDAAGARLGWIGRSIFAVVGIGAIAGAWSLWQWLNAPPPAPPQPRLLRSVDGLTVVAERCWLETGPQNARYHVVTFEIANTSSGSREMPPLGGSLVRDGQEVGNFAMDSFDVGTIDRSPFRPGERRRFRAANRLPEQLDLSSPDCRIYFVLPPLPRQ